MKISKLIGETTVYDKKVQLEERKPKSWLKSVSAFANGEGGALIFGVSDNDQLVGITQVKEVLEKISEAVRLHMNPVPEINLKVYHEDDKDIVVLYVAAGNETPYYYSGDGNLIAFIRVGNESIPADTQSLRRLILKGNYMTFDNIKSKFAYSDVSFLQLKGFYKKQTGIELTNFDLLSFELMDDDGHLTNAGALMADQPIIRHSRLFCTKWNGLSKASGIMDALDDKEYEGSLITLLQNGLEFIKNNSKVQWKKVGAERLEFPDYPPRAVHEALVNALIHRDYMILGSEVHIDMFDDRIEIYSPGGMPDGSQIQNLDINHIASVRRNPVIADIFGRMHLMERRGSGFKKIQEEYHKSFRFKKSLEPEFFSTNSTFVVCMKNLNYSVNAQVSTTGEKVALAGEKVAFTDEKVALAGEKVAFTDEKVALAGEKGTDTTPKISLSSTDYMELLRAKLRKMTFNEVSKNRMIEIFYTYGFSSEFGRSEIIKKYQLAPSSAGKFLKKMREIQLIRDGEARGKYMFSKTFFDDLTEK